MLRKGSYVICCKSTGRYFSSLDCEGIITSVVDYEVLQFDDLVVASALLVFLNLYYEDVFYIQEVL